MKNTILLSPSNEQLLQIAKENPELNAQIRSDIVAELKKNGIKYVQRRLQQQANDMFANLFKTLEKKYFKQDSWGRAVSFAPDIEKEMSAKIEAKLKGVLDEELDNYLNSSAFDSLLRTHLQQQLLQSVIKNLDAQIQTEAKKLLG
jgi:C-terminal processing protease CtpA/Prc